MNSLLFYLWSIVLPAALALCVVLTFVSHLAEGLVLWRTRKAKTHAQATTPYLNFSFALPLAPVVLLLALWLSPQTVATVATLLARQSPEGLFRLFTLASLALLFLWFEGSSVASTYETAAGTTENKTTPTTPLERLAARVFGEPPPSQGSLAYSAARATTVLFALCCLLSLLLDLVPTLTYLFWHQAARASTFAPLQTIPSDLVGTLCIGLFLLLALPQFFSQPNKVIAGLLLLLLPCVLLFYGALCLVATRQANAIAVDTLPLATQSTLNANTLQATLGIFRPAFGWLALLCCVPYAVPQPTTARKAATVLSLCLAFVCLIIFVGMTAAPIIASQAWLLGEQGFNPLRAAFFSLYPNEGWLLEASIAALSATTLLALSALVRAALEVIHKKATSATLTLLMLAIIFGLGSSEGGRLWQASLLFALQHTQEIGQLAQSVATLLFLAALCALALRTPALRALVVWRR